MKNTMVKWGLAFGLLVSGIANASGFYLEGGLSALRQRDIKPAHRLIVATPELYADGSTRYTIQRMEFDNFSRHDINDVRNPMGIFAFGYEWSWSHVSIDWKIYQHRSFIPAADRGEDSTGLYVRWYPFGR